MSLKIAAPLIKKEVALVTSLKQPAKTKSDIRTRIENLLNVNREKIKLLPNEKKKGDIQSIENNSNNWRFDGQKHTISNLILQ